MPQPSFSFRSVSLLRAARRVAVLACGFIAAHQLPAAVAEWSSPLLGRTLALEVLEPTGEAVSTPAPSAGAASTAPRVPLTDPLSPARAAPPAVFYFNGLDLPRAGTEPDASIIRDLRADGCLVVVLDYAHDARARPPGLAREFVALRHALQHRTLLADRALDLNHIYFVPGGHRLRREVIFCRDAGRSFAMDIIYPSHPAQPVGAVLEFSCDNLDRMSSGSLDFCTDSLLPCAAAAGLAVAMADHPVAAPYHGLDPMPDSARKIKAAVRTLRAEGGALGLDGRVVPAGFSRGSGMALMLATTQDHPEFDGFGEHPAVDSRVQGAVVMSGRFTYLDLRAGDKMLPRYVKAWGDLATHRDVWRAHGALDYLEHATVPLFLTINSSEGPDALHQMDVLRQRLDALGSPYTYIPEAEPRGHRMPLDPAVVAPLLDYLQRQLRSAPADSPAPVAHSSTPP